MKIKVINPNMTDSMTESIGIAARKYANPDTEIVAVSAKSGVSSIECYVDEFLSVPAVLEEIAKGDLEGCDAYVIACFSDPGLQAAREVTDKPVLGICESAIMAAKVLAPSFSIVSVLDRGVKLTADIVESYGAASFCKSIRSSGLGVLDFGRDPERGMRALEEQCKLAVKEDKAECVLLGCAGFVDFVEKLNKELGVPVLDGVSPAVKFAEAMVGMKLSTCKYNTWKAPEPKDYIGYNIRL